MKKLAVFFLTLGLACSLLAAPERYIVAIKKSEVMRELTQKSGGEIFIIDITEQRSFNCAGCYEFEMRYYSPNNPEIQTTNFQTRDTNFDGPRILVFNK